MEGYVNNFRLKKVDQIIAFEVSTLRRRLRMNHTIDDARNINTTAQFM